MEAHQDRGSLALKRSRIIFAHILLAARSLAISSKKSIWELKKKESLDANESTSSPFLRINESTYSIPSRRVKASS
jgi:hypothetical protein